MDEHKLGDVVECQCGRQIQLNDYGALGYDWSHLPTEEDPKGMFSCDPRDPIAWVRGDEFMAKPKED